MKVNFKDLSEELKKELKSILNGNGLKINDVIIHKDGEQIILEIKKTGQFVSVP